MPKLRAIVFDLDDTLYAESEYVMSGFRAVADWAAEHLGVDAATTHGQLVKLHQHGIRDVIFDRWLEEQGLDPRSCVSSMVEAYRCHLPRIMLDEQAPSLLETLAQNYLLGLLTDGYFEVQQKKIKALGLAKYFHSIVISDQWGREFWKPHEKPYREVLTCLRCPAALAVYIGDNPRKDFIGARNVGMQSIRILRDGGVHAELEPANSDYEADYTIGDLDELLDALGMMESNNLA